MVCQGNRPVSKPTIGPPGYPGRQAARLSSRQATLPSDREGENRAERQQLQNGVPSIRGEWPDRVDHLPDVDGCGEFADSEDEPADQPEDDGEHRPGDGGEGGAAEQTVVRGRWPARLTLTQVNHNQ